MMMLWMLHSRTKKEKRPKSDRRLALMETGIIWVKLHKI